MAPFVLNVLFGSCFAYNIMASEIEKKLRTDIFKTYSNEVRPVADNNDSVTVLLALQVNQLLQINEDKNFFEMAAIVKQTWWDPQLEWNPDNYGGIESINVSPDKVWRPDIMVSSFINDGNAEHGGYLKRMKTDVFLMNDGSINWDSRIILKANCDIDVRLFPNDQQSCVFR